MLWYKVHLTSVKKDGEYLAELHKRYSDIVALDKDMALIVGGISKDKTVNIYFTPACALKPAMKYLMDIDGAVRCEEPTRETESECRRLCGNEKWSDYDWSSRR